MKSIEITCVDCGKPAVVKSHRAIRCELCKDIHYKEYQRNYQAVYQPAYQKEYQKSYQKAYTGELKHKREDKRTYSRSNVTNSRYLEYCRKNHDTVQGCLECICPECLEPIKSDDFLRWEKEEQFFEDAYT